MSVRLVSTTDHPRPSILDERHEAEWLQHLLNDEQAEANTIAAFVGPRVVFAAGIAVGLVIGIVILLIVKGAFYG